MNTILYTFLLACSVFLGGCYRTSQGPEVVAQEKEPPRQAPEVVAGNKEPPPMIQIQNLLFADKNLTLDFRVSNPFKDDIRICYHPSFYGKEEAMGAATRIVGETVRIQLRCNIQRFPGFENPISVARYIRLKPGESCSGRIVRDLPIKDYVREWRESRKEHKEITLRHAIFEVGYFGPKWNKHFVSLSEWSNEWSKKESIKPKPRIDGPFYLLPYSPLVTEETVDGQLREVIYVNYTLTTWIRNEEFAEVVMNDVVIPCFVVDDDKSE